MNGAERESGRPEQTTRTRVPGRCDRASTTAAGSDLTLPDGGLAADDLPAQSADRAQDVPTSQGRLGCLLRANAAVVGDLSLPVVLRRIVDAARELVMARHGALGIIGPDGRCTQIVNAGMDQDLLDRIGPGAHPVAAGFPDHHPPMASFLGVPIRVRGQLFGNLYLTDSANGEFSAEDERLVTAFVSTAGTAIGNARLHQDMIEQRRWLDASSELTQTLFARTTEPPLDAVLRFALQAASADMATFTAPWTEQTGRVDAAAGALADRAGALVDLDRTLAGRVIRSGKPVLIGDYAVELDTADLQDLPSDIGAVIAVPVLGPDSAVRGALIVAHARNRAHLTMHDRDHLTRFADHAGVALELERARAEHEALRQLEDHERIAADLHDHVIQQIFATGMGLQCMLTQLSRPDQRTRISGYIETLDGTIRSIRNAIYRLHSGPEALPTLRKRLHSVLSEQTASTDLTAHIGFTGPVDELPDPLHDDVIAVLREALSNTVRHANASTVEVTITLAGPDLTVEVTDDGDGIGTPTRNSGLANLRRRARTHAGSLSHDTPPGGGTHLTWTAHIRTHPTVPGPATPLKSPDA